MMIDPTTTFWAMLADRLQKEEVVCLTTVQANGTPQPNPVWFLWQNDSFLIFTTPQAKRLKHIAQNRQVALNLNSAADGNQVVVVTGRATINEPPAGDDEWDPYLAKYAAGIQHLNMTPEIFRHSFSVAIRVTAGKIRGF